MELKDLTPRQQDEALQKAGKAAFKNQNPNQNHNTKKEAQGPNTKR